MRRVAAVTLVLVAAAVLAVVGLGARGGDGGGAYEVRAIFDNAGFVIPGEDVKVAGVKVGTVGDLDVTPDFKAAIVLRIDDAAYQDFRADASCQIRPQGLIGERFVECAPTQKRAAGEALPPALETIEDGPGKGQRLLPVDRTSKPVDLDLLNDVMREPYAQRFAIILNELGTGVAGRGKDLNEVIRRANPALKEIDAVLALLSRQNRQLADLATNSDTVLAPLARERRHVGGALANSATVAAATASRSAQLEADIERLPRFLSELTPTMTRLGALSDEMTPVLSDLGDVAPEVNRLIIQMGPFSKAAIPALDSLGEAAKVGIPAVTAARPVIADLRRLAQAVRPVASTLSAVLRSFQRTQGIERAMDYVFYQASAINGFDSFGHYLRAGLIVNQCSVYAVAFNPSCSAKFRAEQAGQAGLAAAGPRDAVLQRTAQAIARALGQEVRKARHERARRGAPAGGRAGGSAPRKRVGARGTPAPGSSATPAPPSGAPAPPSPQGSSPAPAPSASPAPSSTPAPSSGQDSVLDYLFGGGG